MRKWVKVVNKLKAKTALAIEAANSHYAGFGPGTANTFRKMVGVPEEVYDEKKQLRYLIFGRPVRGIVLFVSGIIPTFQPAEFGILYAACFIVYVPPLILILLRIING